MQMLRYKKKFNLKNFCFSSVSKIDSFRGQIFWETRHHRQMAEPPLIFGLLTCIFFINKNEIKTTKLPEQIFFLEKSSIIPKKILIQRINSK